MDVQIGHGWRPGIVGEIVRAHALYYGRAWGFGPEFEAKVARELAAFVERYDPRRDLLAHAAARDGTFLGSVTIDRSDADLAPRQAHLRWFIAADAARGLGIGRRLMLVASRFLDASDATSCYLTTFAGLDAARSIYETAGFRQVREAPSLTWGTTVMEQRFERGPR